VNSRTLLSFAAAAAVVALAGCVHPPRAARSTRIERITYHGWTNSLRLASDRAEVVVVPAIGRIMSFRLLEGENVLWEDCSLDAKRGDSSGREWVNFGGDKSWPAPEAEWSRYTGRKQWMPPSAFDALPVEGSVTNGQVVLTSPVDPHYGVRTVRRITLSGAELSVETTYERISGEPSKMAVWVITQFKDPVAVYVPVPENSKFPDGHYKFGKEPWPQLKPQGSLIEITRDPKTAHKMGSDARSLVWVGEKEICLVAPWPAKGEEYPDKGASAEVYTNPDPKKYVELETLGPLSLLKPGDRISHGQHYTLRRRSEPGALRELEKLGIFP
jgi:hypothetical protein